MTTAKEMREAIEEKIATRKTTLRNKAIEYCDTVIEEKIQRAIELELEAVKVDDIPDEILPYLYDILKANGYFPDINYTKRTMTVHSTP